MTSNEDKRRLDFDALLQEIKKGKNDEETSNNGEEDGHEELIAVHIMSLGKNASVSPAELGGIPMDKKSFEEALSNIGGSIYVPTGLPKNQRGVLGCLAGNPLLEIQDYDWRGIRKIRDCGLSDIQDCLILYV